MNAGLFYPSGPKLVTFPDNLAGLVVTHHDVLAEPDHMPFAKLRQDRAGRSSDSRSATQTCVAPSTDGPKFLLRNTIKVQHAETPAFSDHGRSLPRFVGNGR